MRIDFFYSNSLNYYQSLSIFKLLFKSLHSSELFVSLWENVFNQKQKKSFKKNWKEHENPLSRAFIVSFLKKHTHKTTKLNSNNVSLSPVARFSIKTECGEIFILLYRLVVLLVAPTASTANINFFSAAFYDERNK